MAFLVQVVILVKGFNNNRGGANYDDPLYILFCLQPNLVIQKGDYAYLQFIAMYYDSGFRMVLENLFGC